MARTGAPMTVITMQQLQPPPPPPLQFKNKNDNNQCNGMPGHSSCNVGSERGGESSTSTVTHT